MTCELVTKAEEISY